MIPMLLLLSAQPSKGPSHLPQSGLKQYPLPLQLSASSAVAFKATCCPQGLPPLHILAGNCLSRAESSSHSLLLSTPLESQNKELVLVRILVQLPLEKDVQKVTIFTFRQRSVVGANGLLLPTLHTQLNSYCFVNCSNTISSTSRQRKWKNSLIATKDKRTETGQEGE